MHIPLLYKKYTCKRQQKETEGAARIISEITGSTLVKGAVGGCDFGVSSISKAINARVRAFAAVDRHASRPLRVARPAILHY